MVFQKANPFPKSVYDNVAYGRASTHPQQGQAGRDRRGSLKQAALWDEVKNG